MTPIPAEPPMGGVFWSVVVPAGLLLVTFFATYLLYRHFAGRAGGAGDDGPRPR